MTTRPHRAWLRQSLAAMSAHRSRKGAVDAAAPHLAAPAAGRENFFGHPY
jgi:hypothetical protein